MYPPPPHSAAPVPPSAPPQMFMGVATGTPMSSTNTHYNNNEKPLATREIRPRVPWSSGLCACTSNCRNCCITCWCPCITFGQIAEIVDKGSCSCGASGALYMLICCVTCCQCCYSCFYRSKLRQQYMLRETPCNDCLLHCFCEPCALCQEYRELQNRGYDMSIGWHGNMEKRNRGVAMIPMATTAPTMGGMAR